MISIVIPCYNEQETIAKLYAVLAKALDELGEPAEVILVDDGSRDRTWSLVSDLTRRDPRWKGVRLARNFGQQCALSAGIAAAAGACVILLDADLQDPPQMIKTFVTKWREGYGIVYGIRTRRKETFIKRACYKLFYRLLNRLSDIDIPLDSGDFCLMDRKVVDTLKAMPEHRRFLRGMRAWLGFQQLGVPYERDARVAGVAKYTLRKLLALAFDGIFSFSRIPLRCVFYTGVIAALLAILGGVVKQALSLAGHPPAAHSLLGGLLAPVILGMTLLTGVQLGALGIVGEYIGRIYDEVRRRPLWTVADTAGFANQPFE